MTTADEVMREAIMSARRCTQNCSVDRSCACAADVLEQITALRAAGFAIVPNDFSSDALQTFRPKSKTITYQPVTSSDGRVRLEVHIDFRELYHEMLKAAQSEITQPLMSETDEVSR